MLLRIGKRLAIDAREPLRVAGRHCHPPSGASTWSAAAAWSLSELLVEPSIVAGRETCLIDGGWLQKVRPELGDGHEKPDQGAVLSF